MMLLHRGCGGELNPQLFGDRPEEEQFVLVCSGCNIEDPDGVTEAFNLRTTPWILKQDPNAVYVGRRNQQRGLDQSPWANTFVVGRDGDRQEVIARFRAYAEKRLIDEPTWLDPLRFTGALVCWCVPEDCHIEVLVALLR